ncbi:MAG: peptide chain release factor N(5)-glutamine methyltransferase [Chloroflexota bacterium]|nr:peptide chain release factor N(5)-glutamine methyltransferase [Chloroflexota bacterium]
MATVEELIKVGVERLRASGSESPRLDAELLLARRVGLDRTRIVAYPEAPVGESAAAAYDSDLSRRELGEPIAYIRGIKEFHGLAFVADPRALIPRPETERLVELAEAEVVTRLLAAPRPPGTRPIRVVDIGTGSGPIAIALAVALRRRRMLNDVRIMATDLAPEALQLARENAVGHGVGDRIEFIVADLLPLDGELIDVVAANLPYVASAIVDELPVAASFEPREALDGGADGLDVIRALLERLPRVLRPDGVALLEIGSDQAQLLASETAARIPGWACEVLPDLAGLPRVARLEPAA